MQDRRFEAAARQAARWAGGLVTIAMLLVLSTVRAEDTDLFASPNQNATGEANVLLVFDNAASFSASTTETCNISSTGVVTTTGNTAPTALSGTAGGIEQCALYAALSSLAANSTATFNVGMMMFNSNGMRTYSPTTDTFSSSCVGSNGGCLVLPLVPFNSTNKPRILNWIKNWTSSGNSDYNVKGPSNMASGAIMQESWAFFKGKQGVSGVTYPPVQLGCGKNFVIYLGNAFRNNTTPGDSTGAAGPKDPLLGMSTAAKNADPPASTSERTPYTDTVRARYKIGSDQITCSAAGGESYTFTTTENSGNYGPLWAKYMFNQHEIKTFTVGLLGADCTATYSAWLERTAEAGNGEFFPSNNYESLSISLRTVLSRVIAVNSVFASVSLPVSVNTQGSYLNQVYIGMFRPDSSFLPLWYGNLKQYKLAFSGSSLRLVDAAGSSAINTTTGFIDECSQSFWTPGSADLAGSYWADRQMGTCSTKGSKASDYPDGNIVEKGAQAYLLRQITPGNRVVKTCGLTMSSCSNLTDFSATAMASVTPSEFGVTATTDRDDLINWARGTNLRNELAKGTGVMRPSSHGDVMHSRPVAVNYGSDASPQVVVFYGANDGMLHAINGNQTGSISSGGITYQPGQELWSFMPPEFYGKIQRLYENTKAVSYKGTLVPDAAPKDYGIDGPLTAFKGSLNGVARTLVFATMRRGGRGVYAFDVSTPGSPSLAWKAGCSSASLTSTDCTANGSDYSGFGQTWAPARVVTVAANNAGSGTLLLMGGGYDSCEDSDTATANHSCASSKGARMYLLDAANGAIVASFPTIAPYPGGAPRGIISDSTVVTDSQGRAKYAYFGDLGGVVYRLDLTGNNKSNWSMTAIGQFGCATPNTACSANRKFMAQPSVLTTDNETYQILIGSGDREKPVSGYVGSTTVSNYFFSIKDRPSSATWLTSENTNCGADVICLNSLLALGNATPDAAVLATKKGWYLGLAPTEQVVTSALTIFGITTFSTHAPAIPENSCSNNLGTTRVYNVNYADASPANGTDVRFQRVAGDGLPPSPVAGKVLIDGVVVPFCIGCSKDSPLEGVKATQASSIVRPRSRLYWFLEKN